MGGQLTSKAHVNFRQFTAVIGVACKLSCAIVNLNFHDNLQCCLSHSCSVTPKKKEKDMHNMYKCKKKKKNVTDL